MAHVQFGPFPALGARVGYILMALSCGLHSSRCMTEASQSLMPDGGYWAMRNSEVCIRKLRTYESVRFLGGTCKMVVPCLTCEDG
jgi:hypothetical protein